MRGKLIIPALLLFLIPACQVEELPSEDELGEIQLASTGNPAIGQSHYEAVAAIKVLLPLKEGAAEGASRTEYRYCSGVLVGEKVVLTAASCLGLNLKAEIEAKEDNTITDTFLDADSVTVQFGSSASGETAYTLDTSSNNGTVTYGGLTMHRYYDIESPGNNDFALLELSVSPGITPVTIRETALVNDAMKDKALELVGYGKNDSDGGEKESFTTRNFVAPLITEVTTSRVKAGTTEETTCYADGGGPGFFDFNGSVELVSVNVLHRECRTDVRRQRVDLVAKDYIVPVLMYASGGCEAAGACDDCDFNGTCKEDCPTRDWDCDLGVMTGEICVKNGDCEEGGHCIAATDEPSNLYCAKSCVDDKSCPSTMTCHKTEKECVYEGVSPGSTGWSCSLPSECRSGFCEGLLCAETCDVNDAAACDLDAGLLCLPSVSDSSTTVCRMEERTGGGGFCAISPAGSTSTGARNGFFACFGILFLAGLLRRRKAKLA